MVLILNHILFHKLKKKYESLLKKIHIAYFQDQQKKVHSEKERKFIEFQKEKDRGEIVMKELLVRSFARMYIHLFYTITGI